MTDQITLAVTLLSASELDLEAAKARFAFQRRVTIPNYLDADSAAAAFRTLSAETPWGFTYQDGAHARHLTYRELEGLTRGRSERIARVMQEQVQAGAPSFCRHSFPLQGEQALSAPHQAIRDHVGSPDFTAMVQAISGKPDLELQDVELRYYAHQHFSSLRAEPAGASGKLGFIHLFAQDWQPEWGGYVQFYTASGDIAHGIKPSFNTLILFDLQQPHAISMVPGFAMSGCFSVCGSFAA